jgi:hypothetical protein
MIIEKAVLKIFNSADYTADILLSGSFKTLMKNVTVARNIPSAAMIINRNVTVLFYDGYYSRDALVIAVYS